MKRNRRVKILATLGPSTDTPEMISRLFHAGADVFRINMSHASHEKMQELAKAIRKVETEAGRPIGILVDLQGPKLRLGDIKDDKLKVEIGDEITFQANPAKSGKKRIHLPHPEIFKGVHEGHRLLIDDGKMTLEVKTASEEKIVASALTAGKLSSRKGISLPDSLLPMGAMTDKDFADLDFAVNQGIDWIALSFVQRVEDIAQARKLARGRAAILAKLEKPSAIQALDDIIEVSDGLMVARGDLGVEMPVEQVPGLQKRITNASRRAGKPVIIATQMLESMISSPVPTRAEVSDVAAAVYDGADAVMLSAESAAGQYPVEAVATMDRIAQEVEQDELYSDAVHTYQIPPEPTGPDAIAAAVNTVSETLNLSAIVCYTSSGSTGMRVARERPNRPILALTPIVATGRRMALTWGLHSVLTNDPEDLDDMVDKACRIVYQEGFAKPGQRVIITAGVPLGTPGATNMLRIAFVGDDGKMGI